MSGHRPKPGVVRESAAERAMRDEEVLRANRELAAYFNGKRTEREARAALKIIKAFVRDRQRRDAKSRPPLPGATSANRAIRVTSRKGTPGTRVRDQPPRRTERPSPDTSSTSASPAIQKNDASHDS